MSGKGFESMDKKKHQQASSKGGQATGGQEDTSKKGLASADQQTREEVASMGGKAAHEQRTEDEREKAAGESR